MIYSEQNNENFEKTIRPMYLNEFIGQNDIKNKLQIFIGAAKNRNETLDHVLLYGPPGLGKTTLANIIANEMEGNIKTITGPSIEKPGDLASVLSTLEAGDVLFIDEIHRLPKIVEEILYSAMEDFKLTVIITRDQESTAVNLELPPFTLIGATTKSGDLSAPLRSRFGIHEKLTFYDEESIEKIIKRTSKVVNTKIDDESAKEIAKRSRGTPRIANRLYKRVRDYINYQNIDIIDIKHTKKALKIFKINALGLDDIDLKYLDTLVNRFHCGPVGIETLANTIGEEVVNLEEIYEPYLLQIGFINRTMRGREATGKAITYCKKVFDNKQIEETE